MERKLSSKTTKTQIAMKPKTLSFLLAVLMSMMASVANAYDAEINGIYYNFSGTTAIVTYQLSSNGTPKSDYSGNVTIPKTVTYNGETYSVTSIDGKAFYGCTGLKSVTISNSVTSIGGKAFSGCSGLTSFVVENGNTKFDSRNGCNAIIETASNTLIVGCKNTIIPNNVTTIGERAFRSCTGLTSIEIPNSVTSIGSSAFRECSGLTSIEIPNSVTEIGSYAFNDCTGLTSVIVAWATPINLLNSNTFSNASNATLYVPKGTKEAYEAARYWKNFKEIVEYEMEETGIEAIDNGQLTMDNAKGVYDLSGRRMNVNVNVNVNVNNSKFEIQNSKLRKGIYIVNGKKTVVK